MRLRSFIIVVIIFTVLYTIFCYFYNKKYDKQKQDNFISHALSMINIEMYNKFASFYGVTPTVDANTIFNIYTKYYDYGSLVISKEASIYNITSIEFIIIILYLEYNGLLKNIMKVSADIDNMRKLDNLEIVMVQKYYELFAKKYDFNSIVDKFGLNCSHELSLVDRYYMAPGIRIIDSKIYYVGDYL